MQLFFRKYLARKKLDSKMNLIPRVFSFCRLIHEVKVNGMQRHRLEVQSASSSSPNTDNFHLIVVSLSFNGKTWFLRQLSPFKCVLSGKTACYAEDRQLENSQTICGLLCFHGNGLLACVTGSFGLQLSVLWKTSRRKIKFWQSDCVFLSFFLDASY